MSLEKWVEYGWLKREPTSSGEIKDLLGIVECSLSDSKVEAVSTDLRFIAAFKAALCSATTTLRASGHRTVTSTMRKGAVHLDHASVHISSLTEKDRHRRVERCG